MAKFTVSKRAAVVLVISCNYPWNSRALLDREDILGKGKKI
jgi:hypothetical protein